MRKRKKDDIPLSFAPHTNDLTIYLKEIYYGKRKVEFDTSEGVIIFSHPTSNKYIYSITVAKGLNPTENFWIAMVYYKFNNNTAKRYKRSINIIKASANKAPNEVAKIILLRELK